MLTQTRDAGISQEERDALYEMVQMVEEGQAARLDSLEIAIVGALEDSPAARELFHAYDMARVAVTYEIMCAAYRLGRRHGAER